MLAGWRGADGEKAGVGAVNEGQLDAYVANQCFWREEMPEGARYFKHANREYLQWAVGMGLIDKPEPIVLQLYAKHCRSSASPPRAIYYDVHGTPMQRFQNFLCLAYGADAPTFKDFVDKGMLPKDRAADCADEYRQVRNAFMKTIFKNIDEEQMKQVQATQWFKPEDGK